MTLTTDQRKDVVHKYKVHDTDTGSPEVQVALLSTRISTLTEHFKTHKKDFAGRRGLLKLVSRRRSLLDYLNRKDPQRYSALIASLNLRK